MRVAVVIAALIALMLHPGPHGAAAAESSGVADAFSRLDALAEELTGWRRLLGRSGAAATPPAAGATGAPKPDATDDERTDEESRAVTVATQGSPASCGSRQEMVGTITALRERYQDHGRAIIGVNDALPSFRTAVLDMELICTERLADELASTLERVEGLDLAADYRIVDTLTICVDRLREETDDELSATTSNIRMKRLAVEMERLGRMTHRVADLERALLRAISKRDRLVYEFGQLREEMEAVCR